jgi:putative type I restriction system specificity protein
MLKDLCEIKYGKSITASKLDNNGKYTVYGGNGIIGTLDDYMFDKSKISISCRGAAAGNVLLTTSFSTISSNSLYLNLYDESLTLPLYAFLLKARLNNYVTGSAQPQITIENIKFLKVPIFDDYKNDNFNYIIDLINNNIEKLNKLNLIKQNLLSKYF